MPPTPCFSLYLANTICQSTSHDQIGRYPICQFLNFCGWHNMCSWKSPNSTESKTFSSVPLPTMQVLQAARCTKAGSAPLLSNVNLVHGGAQMHRYFYQFIRKKVITMWRQVTPTPRYSGSSLILVPAHTSTLLHSRYHIPLRQDRVVAHFLYKRRAEPIKQLHVPRQQH